MDSTDDSNNGSLDSMDKREQSNDCEDLESLAMAQENLTTEGPSTLPSLWDSLYEICESNPAIREAVEKFDAALKENITIDNIIKPEYSSLIERVNRSSKIERATPLRDTLIKCVVLATRGTETLQQQLGMPKMIPSSTLLPAEFLKLLGELSLE